MTYLGTELQRQEDKKKENKMYSLLELKEGVVYESKDHKYKVVDSVLLLYNKSENDWAKFDYIINPNNKLFVEYVDPEFVTVKRHLYHAIGTEAYWFGNWSTEEKHSHDESITEIVRTETRRIKL